MSKCQYCGAVKLHWEDTEQPKCTDSRGHFFRIPPETRRLARERYNAWQKKQMEKIEAIEKALGRRII